MVLVYAVSHGCKDQHKPRAPNSKVHQITTEKDDARGCQNKTGNYPCHFWKITPEAYTMPSRFLAIKA